MINCDFHVHSTYCDGKNTLEEIAEAAVKKQMTALGFSGHSHTSFDESYCMSAESTEKYILNVKNLKLKYKDILPIYLGIEMDRFSDLDNLSRFDYVIGSVHYVKKDGCYLPVDESEEVFLKGIKEHYDGDIIGFCEDYFKEVCCLAEIDEVDIIGHIDLVTKFNEGGRLFDTADSRYVSAVDEALGRLAAKGKILEINTGAMSRGYRKTPYPEESILLKWQKLGGRIIFLGAAHSTDGLCFEFNEAEKLAKKCGFSSAVVVSGRAAKTVAKKVPGENFPLHWLNLS
ncbi:MAG: histidinol-phosphatase [Clostridiales bacterium]|nr:histidinol-phosphatase [Clostridiales bacterium]